MQIEDTGLPDLKVLTPRRFGDARGFFSVSWNKRLLADLGVAADETALPAMAVHFV